jgi:hypothetical protein
MMLSGLEDVRVESGPRAILDERHNPISLLAYHFNLFKPTHPLGLLLFRYAEFGVEFCDTLGAAFGLP